MIKIECPSCGSRLQHDDERQVTKIIKRGSNSNPPSQRIKLMVRIIYLLVGALLALSGVSLKAVM